MGDLALAAGSATIAMLALAALRLAAARLPVAHPNERTLHRLPVPRVGGIAIWAGALPVALVSPPAGIATRAWLAGFVLVAIVSAIDDWRGVHPMPRLAVHAAAAALAVAGFAGAEGLDVVAPIAAAVAIVWASNLYNFMDGSDGLAALMAVSGFATLGAAASLNGAPGASFYGIAAASLVFLVSVNAPPARMFMGDVGAVPMGFVAATWGVAGSLAGVYPGWLVALVFLPFWSDATATLVARLARGERVFTAHRSHYYQRLHVLGAGHRGTLYCFGALMLLTAISALLTLAFAPAAGWFVLGAWIAIHAAIFAAIEYHWRKRCLPVQ